MAVDQVVGSREIVVKSGGPQLLSIPGIFGATIMGDGRVVVILDVVPLVRRFVTAPREAAPVVSAVEADLGTYLAAQRETSGRGRAGSPELALLAGQSDAASIRASSRGTTTGSGSDVQQAAVDISTRLLDAVRSHAAAQAVASDSRISLGDLTLIAFADSKRQMAAATSHAEHTPDPHPLHKAIDNSAHKKFMEDRKGFDNKLKKVAELAIESLEKSKRIAKERFGSHG